MYSIALAWNLGIGGRRALLITSVSRLSSGIRHLARCGSSFLAFAAIADCPWTQLRSSIIEITDIPRGRRTRMANMYTTESISTVSYITPASSSLQLEYLTILATTLPLLFLLISLGHRNHIPLPWLKAFRLGVTSREGGDHWHDWTLLLDTIQDRNAAMMPKLERI